MRAALTSRFTNHRMTMLVSKERYQDLLPLTELIETGQIKPSIDRVVALAEYPEL